MPQVVRTPDALLTFPVFSQAMISRGYVYVSGNIGCKEDLKTLVEGGVQSQAVRFTSIPSTCWVRLQANSSVACRVRECV